MLAAVLVDDVQVAVTLLDCSFGVLRDIQAEHLVELGDWVFDTSFDRCVENLQIDVALGSAVGRGRRCGSYQKDGER